MSISSQPLDGQVALITGCSSGLGRAAALAFAQAGARIGLVARSAGDLEKVAREVESVNRQALALVADLAREDQILDTVTRVLGAFGRVDVLVNAAGTDMPAPVVDLSTEAWDRVLDVNLRAPFLLARAVFPSMIQAERGTIINISSVAGKRGWANAAAYCASKFGLTGLTQVLAAEGKAHGIRACVVYPGGMATNWGTWSSAEGRTQQDKSPPAREALPPSEIAALLVWIAAAPAEMVLNEVIATPILEGGWP
jgi:NAD(P)-dependent dehydrogenase (short-subunit alcohol dehydrogenase family)